MHRNLNAGRDAVTLYRLGRDPRGNWVLSDERGHGEAIFRDRRQAIHYALFGGSQPGAVLETTACLEMKALR